MSIKDEAIALYLECVRENGLTAKMAEKLPVKFHRMLMKNGEGKFFLAPRFRKMFSVALTGGVFDIIHPGHVLTLTEAKKCADVLVVVVAMDATVMKNKKRKPMHPAKMRAEMVGALKSVDLAVVGMRKMNDTLLRVSPNTVVFGYDQKFMEIDGVKTVQIRKSDLHPNSKTSALIEKLGT